MGGTKVPSGLEERGSGPCHCVAGLPGSLPLSGGLSDAQRGCVLPPSFPPRRCSSLPGTAAPSALSG